MTANKDLKLMISYTIALLEKRVALLNDMTQSPTTYRDENNKINVGHWFLSQAYGGVCVARIANENGGEQTPIWHGYIPKRDAFNRISAFTQGLMIV